MAEYTKWTTDRVGALLPYASTKRAVDAINAFVEADTDVELAARICGQSVGSLRNRISYAFQKAAEQGYAPEHDMESTAPETHYVKGVSSLYRIGENGERQLSRQWVKTDKRKDEAAEWARELIEALSEDLPPLPKRKADKKSYAKDLITVYPLGDPHIGMLAWAEETGEDFDLKIAERNLCGAVDRLVHTAPECETALIANLGDFFHADNLDGMTSRGGNRLDTDSRWPKALRVGVSAMRRCIESALDRHKTVHVINAIGNHDDHSAMFLSVALAQIYSNEPRVIVNDAPTIMHYHQFGNNLFAVHHGHTRKLESLPLDMATERPKEWSESENRYIFVGHFHHSWKLKEVAGVKVEGFRTLAAKDAWHVSKGYKAGRDMQAIVYHREWGEIQRSIVNVAMLQAEL